MQEMQEMEDFLLVMSNSNSLEGDNDLSYLSIVNNFH